MRIASLVLLLLLSEPAQAGRLLVAGSGAGAIARMMDALRQANADHVTGDFEITLSGTFTLSEPLRITAAESRFDGSRIILRGVANARLTSARSLAGWRLVDAARRLYQAPVPDGVIVRQLTIDGAMATRASGALTAYQLVAAPDGYVSQSGLPLPQALLGADVVDRGKWMMNRCRIVAVSDTHLRMDPVCWMASQWSHRWGAGTPAHAEHALMLLDAPGEWYADAHSVYLIAPDGFDPNAHLIAAPQLMILLSLDGAHDIDFTGLVISDAAAPAAVHGYSGLQAGYAITPSGSLAPLGAAVDVSGSTRIRFTDLSFHALGARALSISGGSTDITIQHGYFHDLGAGAIHIGSLDPAARERNIVITATRIREIGQDYSDDPAISASYVQNLSVTQNEITAIPHTAISIGWGWSQPGETGGNHVAFNRISDFSRDYEDSAAIYTLGRQPGTVIEGNVIRNGGKGYGCLYPDEGSAFEIWRHNICQNVRQWLHLWHPSIHDNHITDNWSDTDMMVNGGRNNSITGNVTVRDGLWPAAAQAILSRAGIGPDQSP